LVIFHSAAVRVDCNVIITGSAEYFCINMATAIAPEVKLTALNAEGNLTAITENNSRDFPAPCAGSVIVVYNDHDL